MMRSPLDIYSKIIVYARKNYFDNKTLNAVCV